MILTELGGFSTPAGHIGPRFEVGHDVSLLIPEVWCRMGPSERDPKNMIKEGSLERVEDFQAGGESIPASRLGYRITRKFVRRYLARVFDNPAKVFTDEILKPELQDPDSFADGILYIAEAQKRVALLYMEDGGYEMACPPVRAALSIMAYGEYEGKTLDDPELRKLFDRETLLASDWYRQRLAAKKHRDIQHWQSVVDHVTDYIAKADEESIESLGLTDRLMFAQEQLKLVRSDGYEQSLVGAIGLDPMQPAFNSPAMINRLASV
jgi:phosphoenolpyruvate carboxykinase (diphosphate)